VTGVQTCALPISRERRALRALYHPTADQRAVSSVDRDGIRRPHRPKHVQRGCARRRGPRGDGAHPGHVCELHRRTSAAPAPAWAVVGFVTDGATLLDLTSAVTATSTLLTVQRSEERRVGKECRPRG